MKLLLTDLHRDIALGIRLLARDRGFTAVSIVTLAVATGGNTAVFTIVNALLLTPPPVVEPARLARVDTGQSLASWPTYQDVRERTDVFADVAAYRLTSRSLDLGGSSIKLRGQITSANYLTVLGVSPERGRMFDASESDLDRVVLAHHIWLQHFGSDPNIVGRTVRLGGRSFQVAGVMPRGFRGLAPPGVRLDFWLPVNTVTDAESLRNRLLSQFEIVGRLRPGVDHVAATAALRPMATRLRLEHPELPESMLAMEAESIDGVNAFQGMASLLLPVFAFLALLTVISAFVLVIGCSNIAGLLVGRAAMRQREIAVRLSLGASRSRLLRQLLTESLVLALAGGVAGLLLARGLVTAMSAGLARLPVPLDLSLSLDYRVLVYVLALSTATAVFFGLLPARSALRVDLASSLKIDTSASPERQRLRRLMVTAQVAICSALIVWSILFLRSLGNIHAIEPGFDSTGVMLATVELDRGAIDATRGDQILTDWTQRVAASTGIHSAALATIVPLALTGREEFDVSLPGDSAGTRRRVVANRITPGWFDTVRIRLVGGRDFTWNDRAGAPHVAIVDETLARQFWGGNALGQWLVYGDRSIEVVGVAAASKYRMLGEIAQPLIYLPLRQEYAHFATLFARTSDPRATSELVTREFQRLQPGADVAIESMPEAVAVAVLPARIGATVTGGFAAIAVALAVCGVYGLVSFSVLQRTREIGIRRAIGATTTDIVRLVVQHHSMLVSVGLVIGATMGALGAVVFRAFLAGVGPTDPLALFAVIVVVGGSALFASTLPVLRATRVDPMAALRDM
jgi:predicted permease